MLDQIQKQECSIHSTHFSLSGTVELTKSPVPTASDLNTLPSAVELNKSPVPTASDLNTLPWAVELNKNTAPQQVI